MVNAAMLQLIDVPTERTTAATDVLLGVAALGCAVWLLSFRAVQPFKSWIWAVAFVCLAVAALVGAGIHAFQLDRATRAGLWIPVNLSLGLTMALFAVGAIHDGWGQDTAQRTLPVMLLAALLFFAATRIFAVNFGLFLAYEACAMLLALGVYGWLLIRGGYPGAGWMVAGVLLSILAAVLQAIRSLRVTLIWEFDNNGVFHLVQLVAVVVLLVGLHLSLQASVATR